MGIIAENEKEIEKIAALEKEIATQGAEFDRLFGKLGEFADKGDSAARQWTDDESKTEYEMAILTETKREEFNKTDEIGETDAEMQIAQAKYRHEAARNLRKQLEIHRAYLLERISLMKKKLGEPT
jgi:hypothetical protein